MFDEAAPTDLTRTLTRDWLPRLTYGLYHISGFGGVCLSNISNAKTFATEGPDGDVIETIVELVLWLYVRRHRNGSITKALSAT